MTLARPLIAFAALACGLVLITGQAQAQDQVGVTAAMRNTVRTQPAGQTSLRPAVLRAPVRMGDVFVSGPQSTLQILLRDRTTMTMGANARVTIDRFVFSGGRGAGGTSASVARGAFRFVSGQGSSHRGGVQTPVASIGVRGTIVDVLVGPEVADILAGLPDVPTPTGTPDTFTLIILRGPGPDGRGLDLPGAVDVTGMNGDVLSLDRPGMAMLATDKGLFGPFSVSDALSEKLGALLRTEPTGGPDTGLGDIMSAALDAGEGPSFSDGVPTPGSTLQTVESNVCTFEPAVGGSPPDQQPGGQVGGCGTTTPR